MKKLLYILLFAHFVVFGQDSLNSDSLYFIDGKVEGVEIIEIDDLNVKYKYKGEPFAISTNLKKISKILTAKGRIIQFENALKKKTVFTVEDWEKVEITNLSSDVEGLFRVANVTGKAKAITTLASSGKIQNRAMSKMRMQAAFYGCDVVYMLNQTNTESKFGTKYSAGQTAGSTLSGTCYSVDIVKPTDVIDGNYELYKVLKLGLNDMRYYELNDFELTALEMNKSVFINETDHFTYPFHSGIRNADQNMRLIKVTESQLVFLVISRDVENRIKYFNLFFTNKPINEVEELVEHSTKQDSITKKPGLYFNGKNCLIVSESSVDKVNIKILNETGRAYDKYEVLKSEIEFHEISYEWKINNIINEVEQSIEPIESVATPTNPGLYYKGAKCYILKELPGDSLKIKFIGETGRAYYRKVVGKDEITEITE